MQQSVSDATDGKFQIQVFAAGEIVPGLQALDAVSNGTVEMLPHGELTITSARIRPSPSLRGAVGLNQRMIRTPGDIHGGGNDLLNAFFAKGSTPTGSCAATPAVRWAAGFPKEIKTVEDLKGLKFRIGGFAGRVMQKLGAVPQQIAGGDIYPALEKGTIDAAEWVGPYDDEKLGFYKVAPDYYYPGWWEGGPMLLAYVNLDKWNALPKHYQSVLEQAGQYRQHPHDGEVRCR